MAGQAIIPPGGNFPVAIASKNPLLAFRCAAAMKPYLEEDIGTPAGVIINSPVVYSEGSGAQPIDLLPGPLSSVGKLDVTVSLNGKILGNALVPLNANTMHCAIHSCYTGSRANLPAAGVGTIITDDILLALHRPHVGLIMRAPLVRDK